jgi:hypothetical protein
VAVSEIAARMPLGEIPQDADLAEAVVFFCSDRARMITGQYLMVNAGERMTQGRRPPGGSAFPTFFVAARHILSPECESRCSRSCKSRAPKVKLRSFFA